MATVTLQGKAFNTYGDLPKVGAKAPNFILVETDLSETTLADYQGSKLILNIFSSVDTGVCATSIRTFNKKANEQGIVVYTEQVAETSDEPDYAAAIAVL
jgi:thiol peroxidase